MPVKNYGVLKGQVIGKDRENDPVSPHYQIHVQSDHVQFRIAVNVKSQLSPSELLFFVNDRFQHPLTTSLSDLPVGFTRLPSQPGGKAIDYIRGNLFNRLDMRLLPPNLPGPNNDLNDQIEHYVIRAMQESDARVYAFGARWGPEENVKDKVFRFKPGNGIHDIHMNQGNTAKHAGDDGVWQDGALMFAFPSSDQWVAIFLAFQSQAWHTDDRTGHTSSDVPTPGPGPNPSPTEPDHIVRIVGALVNPIGPSPEQETVTLLNTSPESIDLTGWKIADRQKKTCILSGAIAPGATHMVTLPQEVQLGNKGGMITLLDKKGLKVDGVSYTGQQGKKEGWTIVF